eukprot:scaffold24997_cov30-Tisochrysis_lutea.AAC.1
MTASRKGALIEGGASTCCCSAGAAQRTQAPGGLPWGGIAAGPLECARLHRHRQGQSLSDATVFMCACIRRRCEDRSLSNSTVIVVATALSPWQQWQCDCVCRWPCCCGNHGTVTVAAMAV